MFHSGQALFLKDIFGHYEFRRLDTLDNTNLDPRLTRISPTTGERIGLLLNSTAMERRRINDFLATLTGSDVYTNEKWADPFDENGDITIAGITTSTTPSNQTKNSLQIYPNPTSALLTVVGDLKASQIEISNIAGQIYQTKFANEDVQTIDISYLPSGLYFVRVKNLNSNHIKVQKIIKE